MEAEVLTKAAEVSHRAAYVGEKGVVKDDEVCLNEEEGWRLAVL